MKIKVLLAYASTHGSTQEIATAIAATLTERGLVVDLRPVREVRTLGPRLPGTTTTASSRASWATTSTTRLSSHR